MCVLVVGAPTCQIVKLSVWSTGNSGKWDKVSFFFRLFLSFFSLGFTALYRYHHHHHRRRRRRRYHQRRRRYSAAGCVFLIRYFLLASCLSKKFVCGGRWRLLFSSFSSSPSSFPSAHYTRCVYTKKKREREKEKGGLLLIGVAVFFSSCVVRFRCASRNRQKLTAFYGPVH